MAKRGKRRRWQYVMRSAMQRVGPRDSEAEKRRWARHVPSVRARGRCNFGHHTSLTSKQYVSESGWLHASLKRCPSHPAGGCRFSRHGTYPRIEPPGMQVARWYCRDAHRTFSLLPDCMRARLEGSLDEAEQVVVASGGVSER